MEGLSSRWSGERGSSQKAPECEQVGEGSEGVSQGTAGETEEIQSPEGLK